jgi:ribose transport system ATP-binding protein
VTTLLGCTGITKTFPGVRALSSVDFEVQQGEVHALIGENGAGKSTLMHILAGVYPPDSGVIEFQGRGRDPRRALRPANGNRHRISGMDLLTVAENIFAGNQPGRPPGHDRPRQMHIAARPATPRRTPC